MAHAVGFDPQRHVQRVAGHILKKVGAIFGGGAVEVRGADLFHDFKESPLIGAPLEMFAAGEHEMLEEVGKTGLARLLVFRADMIPEVDRDDGGLVVLMNDEGQPVLQDKFLVRNIDLNVQNALRAMNGRQREEANEDSAEEQAGSL